MWYKEEFMTWASTKYVQLESSGETPVPIRKDLVKELLNSWNSVPEVCIQNKFEPMGFAHSAVHLHQPCIQPPLYRI